MQSERQHRRVSVRWMADSTSATRGGITSLGYGLLLLVSLAMIGLLLWGLGLL